MIHARVRRAALGDIPVFLTGESGVGKEIYARALHRLSRRSQRPYLAFNGAAFTRDLAQSELFGHERGAFTGAMHSHSGIVERADGGTLFLDEICDMHPHVQAKLLRFTEDGRYHRIGGRGERRSDVRLICATHQDPEEAVRQGQLRSDLWYRLHGVSLRIPPLRERREDIPVLARHFLRRHRSSSFTGFTPSAQALLREAPWPGNVRQLKNVLEAVCTMERGEKIHPALLEPYLSPGPAPSSEPTAPTPSPEPLRTTRRRMIEQALTLCEFNVTRASAMLGVHPSTLYRYRQHRRQG